MVPLLAVVLANLFVIGYNSSDVNTMKHIKTYSTIQECNLEATDVQVCVSKKDGGAYLFSE